jgi:hypothetical protein
MVYRQMKYIDELVGKIFTDKVVILYRRKNTIGKIL